MPVMNLSAGAIELRRYQRADAEEVFAAIQESRATITPWLPGLAATSDPGMVLKWVVEGEAAWAAGDAYDYAIVEPEMGMFCGGCGITQIHPTHRFANTYYWVRASRQGHGIGSLAVRLLAQFGTTQLALQRLEIVVAVSNTASIRVAEKAGAHYEGTLRNRIRLYDQYHDAAMFSFVPHDFQQHSRDS